MSEKSNPKIMSPDLNVDFEHISIRTQRDTFNKDVFT